MATAVSSIAPRPAVTHNQPKTNVANVDEYQQLADKLLVMAHHVNQFNDERVALLQLPARNKKQTARLHLLASALDSYADCLYHLGELPDEAWITRALKAA